MCIFRGYAFYYVHTYTAQIQVKYTGGVVRAQFQMTTADMHCHKNYHDKNVCDCDDYQPIFCIMK